tara:strand:- start:5 stop:673 length:669 start_codon:yes stop_codon:yes gene_type:complete
MQKHAFITSTGTNIGKTFLTKILIKRAIELNLKVNALKPIISGFNINNLNETDTGIILESLNASLNDIDKISPWRFKDPLSPDIAAENERKYINFQDLLRFCKNNINNKNYDLTLIEGVGGTMVPINDKYTIMDLITDLNIPIILTIGSYLGSISHTLNAYEILNKHNINISSIVMMQSEINDVGCETTLKSLKNYIKNSQIIYFKRNDLDYIKVDKILNNL